MEILLQDIRYAVRKLMRTPGFTLIAVSTLAIAIGASTAVFSIVNGVLLQPLPYHAPDELVKVGSLGKDGKYADLSGPDFIDYRSQTHSFTAMAAVQDANSANLSISGEDPVRLNAASVGAPFFDILGVPMQLGHGFLPGDDLPSGRKVVVISDRLWRERLSSDPQVVGRSISLNGAAYTVTGVAPRAVTYPASPDLWMPFVFESWVTDPDNRGAHFLTAIARLRPRVTLDAGRRDMHTVGERLRAEYPESNTNFGGEAMALQSSITGAVRDALLTMFGAVGFVLLIACANVANLLLVRASSRETELAVRTALGAGRGRIIRQLVTESVMLSLAGAVIGGVLAGWAVDGIVAFGPKGLPRLDEIRLDIHVLAFSIGVALVTGIVFGLVPALHAVRQELGHALKEGTRGMAGRRAAQRTRGALVMGEMALAVVLLIGAGLLIQSFVNLLRVDPGFRPEHVVTFNVSLPGAKYPLDRDVRRFGSRVQEGLAGIPGVQSAAVAFARPMEQAGMRTSFDVIGRAPLPAGKRMLAEVHGATSNFFETVGMRLVRGRLFTVAEETWGPPPAVVVNEAFVRKYFPNEDPIGLTIKLGYSHDTAGTKSSVDAGGRIVGVVNDVHQHGLNREPTPAVYVGWSMLGVADMAFLVRSRLETSALSAAIRQRVQAVDAQMPVYDLHQMSDIVAESVSQPRFYTMLITAFASLALLLAALGVYGVISYSVTQRTRELGIRIALGATRDRVVRLVIGQGLWLAAGGVTAGLLGALWLVRVLGSILYGVGATDPLTFAAVAMLLVGVASLASYLPARRAARVDPVIAMRTE